MLPPYRIAAERALEGTVSPRTARKVLAVDTSNELEPIAYVSVVVPRGKRTFARSPLSWIVYGAIVIGITLLFVLGLHVQR